MAALLDSARLMIQQRTHHIRTLPIVVIYLNNICDSRCGTCSIWKNNDALTVPAERQMTDSLLEELYTKVEEWHTREVLLSGGEPLLHPRFPEALQKFRKAASRVAVITNGLLLGSIDRDSLNAASSFFISFDAPDRGSYQQIRGVDGFERLRSSIQVLCSLNPRPSIVARCTLQRANVRRIPELVRSARDMGFDRISFLGVDVTSQAFSRDRHGPAEPAGIQPTREDLRQMEASLQKLSEEEQAFIEGGVEKLQRIREYFNACFGESQFPEVRCNAPWVSVVVETTGAIRGCFFQPIIGDLNSLNGASAMRFRHALDVGSDPTCRRCVCSKQLGIRDFLRMAP